MKQFYHNRSVQEQQARLPEQYRAIYGNTVLDQIEIDGNVISGYFEYSFLSEKSYFTQPTRSSEGSIENINTYATFLTPRLIIKYDMMNIADYRKLMMILNSKNEFTVTCYDPVLDQRVTHKMYAAPTQMPIIYQQYLIAMGIQEFSLELIGTNNGVKSFVVTYDYNIPIGYESKFTQKSALQEFYANASANIGKTATYKVGESTYTLSSSKSIELLDNNYTFQGWNTKKDGSGFTYIDGDAYFINASQTLYAQWK